MNISFFIDSWVVPFIITIISGICFFVCSAIDNKDKGGYFSFPVLSMLSLLIGGTAAVVAWIMYFVMLFFKS